MIARNQICTPDFTRQETCKQSEITDVWQANSSCLIHIRLPATALWAHESIKLNVDVLVHTSQIHIPKCSDSPDDTEPLAQAAVTATKFHSKAQSIPEEKRTLI
jgi:hypothetical protein